MKNLCKHLLLLVLSASVAASALAQRPPVRSEPAAARPAAEESEEAVADPAPRPARPLPKVVKAKYMGGYMGYKKKQEGMLTFDDRNRRLVFRDEEEREVISLAYEAILTAFADPEERRLMGDGTRDVLMGTVGIFALPGLLFKKKFEFMSIQYKDPDTDAAGLTQFKLKNKEDLELVVHAVAQKAGLVQRGQIFVRKKKEAKDSAEPAAGEKEAKTTTPEGP